MNEDIEETRANRDAFTLLVDTVKRLRSPDGCPWDAEQTHLSLRPNLLEETYETLEAIENGDAAALEEELGDLLIQIVFHADIARRNGDFDAASVCRKVAEKLIRRHPHVFGDAEKLERGDEVVDLWEQIKREEAGGVRSLVASVPKTLPALAQSAVIQRRVKRAGLQIQYQSDPKLTFAERGPDESDAALEKRAGEFLATAVRSVQDVGIDPEVALLKVSSALRDRVLRAEAMAEGVALSDLPAAERDSIWEDAR